VAQDDALGVLKVLTAAVSDFVPSAEAWELANSVQPPVTPTHRNRLLTDPRQPTADPQTASFRL
jgi:hypothetical protein